MTENKLSSEGLLQRQSLSLDEKLHLTKLKIREFYYRMSGSVYVSFSGGRDSTVLLDIVREEFPDVPAVFVDTGLEFPEIRSFVKTIDNVIWLKPIKPFNTVIEEYGYPVISKSVARFIRDVKNRSDKNKNVVNLRLTGYTKDGYYAPSQRIPKKYLYLIDSDFKISEQCCQYLKKYPLVKFGKESGLSPIIGTMASDSSLRKKSYLVTGCNDYGKYIASRPISFWLHKDILEYISLNNIRICDIYNSEEHTGCVFCMFGIMSDGNPNRFQRLKSTHPDLYDYCINKLGCGKVLNLLNVPYE